MADDFPRVEVTGDQEGGWLAEIHDGVFHRVFTSLTGTYEEVKEAALAAFASMHPESPLAVKAEPATGFAAVAPPLPDDTTDSGATHIGGGAIVF